MAEALSQNQIDELLKKMRSGGVEDEPPAQQGGNVREYDFSSPKKFTKDQLKSLNSLYENFGRVASSYFTSILRSVCEVSVVQIEEQRYYEFNNALPDNALVGMISFDPVSKQYDDTVLMLDLSTSFGFFTFDRLLGGTGELFAPDRDYTEIELSVIRLVMEKLTHYLQEAWCNYFSVGTKLRSIETNGRLLQAFSPQDVVVIVTFELKEETFSGTLNICMAAENLEGIINSFSEKYSHATKQQNPEHEQVKRELVLEYMKPSELVLEAVLDDCEMDLGDILRLQVNDVLSLSRKIDDDICVKVEGEPWYTARLGEVKQRRALKIVDVTDK